MKLTTKKLRQMIREELMKEARPGRGDPYTAKLRREQTPITKEYAQELKRQTGGQLDIQETSDATFFELHLGYSQSRFNNDEYVLRFSLSKLHRRPQATYGYFLVYRSGIATGVQIPLTGDPYTDADFIIALKAMGRQYISDLVSDPEDSRKWIQDVMPGYPWSYMK